MNKVLFKVLVFCAFAVPAFAADYCQGGLFIEARGTGKTPSEASNMAIAEIGKRINSLVESQTSMNDYSGEINGVFQEASIYSATSQIRSSAAIGFLQKIEDKRLENGEYEFRGYVCHSDVAKSYLDSLNRYLKDSLEVFLRQELDEDICISVSRVRNKMVGWQRILETLKQVDKNLQMKYVDAIGRIEKDCGEIKKRQTVIVIANGTEPKGSNALKNLELYVKEYLVNSSSYSQVEEGREAKFKCEVEIAQNYSIYTLRAKIVNINTGKIVHNRMVNVESNLKTSAEHKKASMELVSKLLSRCGAMSVGDVYEGECKNGLREGKGKLTYLSGDVYDGYWKNDKFNGQGKLTSSDGSIYEGEFKNGLFDGKGKLIYLDLFVYEGEWKNSKFDGKGKLTNQYGVYEGGFKNNQIEGKGKFAYADGSIYEGEWKNGLWNGKGKRIYANGDVYEGEWKNNEPNGKGKCIYADGNVYNGEWKDGVFHGKGKLTGKNGVGYEGEFKNDHFDGKGKFTYADGGFYDGEWKNGLREGKGKDIYANGEVYEGIWKNDKIFEGKGRVIGPDGGDYVGEFKNGFREGKGKVTYPDGGVYEGEWKNDKFDGNGKSIYANGDVYEGYWKNGLRDGNGRCIYVNGDVYEGEFKNNQPNGKGKITFANGGFYDGEFKNDLPYGKGKYSFADGGLYEGEFKNGSPEKGKWIYANGTVYEGEFKNIKYDGKGKLTYANGEVYEGEFKDGEFLGKKSYNLGNGLPQKEYIESTKTSRPVAIALSVLGAAVIGFAVYENSEMNVAFEKYNKKGYSKDYYESTWQDVESRRSSRNTFYVIGSLILSSGIGVYIWF